MTKPNRLGGLLPLFQCAKNIVRYLLNADCASARLCIGNGLPRFRPGQEPAEQTGRAPGYWTLSRLRRNIYFSYGNLILRRLLRRLTGKASFAYACEADGGALRLRRRSNFIVKLL
jgi:hypothetical protein